MRTRYAVMATTGLNDPSRRLRRIDRETTSWDTFADAKAEAVACADALREYLDSSGCRYQVHCVSRSHRYELWFEYGPSSSEQSLPFRTLIDVRRCKVWEGQTQRLTLSPHRPLDPPSGGTTTVSGIVLAHDESA